MAQELLDKLRARQQHNAANGGAEASHASNIGHTVTAQQATQGRTRVSIEISFASSTPTNHEIEAAIERSLASPQTAHLRGADREGLANAIRQDLHNAVAENQQARLAAFHAEFPPAFRYVGTYSIPAEGSNKPSGNAHASAAQSAAQSANQSADGSANSSPTSSPGIKPQLQPPTTLPFAGGYHNPTSRSRFAEPPVVDRTNYFSDQPTSPSVTSKTGPQGDDAFGAAFDLFTSRPRYRGIEHLVQRRQVAEPDSREFELTEQVRTFTFKTRPAPGFDASHGRFPWDQANWN